MTIDSLTDQELLHFFTEINCNSAEKRNVITSNPAYRWQFISPEEGHSQRIGFRYLSLAENYIKIHSSESHYITQSRQQADKSAVQILLVDVNIYQHRKKIALLYRAPDADNDSTQKMYDIVNDFNPDMALGDINLNSKDTKIAEEIED